MLLPISEFDHAEKGDALNGELCMLFLKKNYLINFVYDTREFSKLVSILRTMHDYDNTCEA